jgi:SH3-like domain-containing protein
VPDFISSYLPRAFPLRLASIAALVLITSCGQNAQNKAPAELPYFANLRPDEAWGRRGPSYKQPVLWEYRRRGLPLLVIDKTELWRQVRDPQGDTVWIHKSLLSRNGIVMIKTKTPIPLYRAMGEDQSVIAYADPMALLRLGPCQGQRCQLRQGNIRGWADRSALWGVDIPADY